MIDEGLEHRWPEGVQSALGPFLQGHLIASPPLFYAADLRRPIWGTTRLVAADLPEENRGEDFVDVAYDERPPWGIITTQSCDLAAERDPPRHPWLSVAPVYRVPAESNTFQSDHIVRLSPPELEDEVWVADLRIEVPLEKGLLVGREPVEAFPNEEGYVQFANLLARRRGRPALASVFHEVLSSTTKRLKDSSGAHRRLARQARSNVYKLMLAISDGTRLEPVAARLFVLTEGPATEEAKNWFGLWWDEARVVADGHGLLLLPVEWIDARQADLTRVDQLIEMRSPL